MPGGVREAQSPIFLFKLYYQGAHAMSDIPSISVSSFRTLPLFLLMRVQCESVLRGPVVDDSIKGHERHIRALTRIACS